MKSPKVESLMVRTDESVGGAGRLCDIFREMTEAGWTLIAVANANQHGSIRDHYYTRTIPESDR